VIVLPKTKFENESTYKHYLENGKEGEFDELFETALERALKSFGNKNAMYIGGRPVYANEFLEEVSPIDNNIKIGSFPKGAKEHAEQAIEEAQRAFTNWRETDYTERISIFINAANILSKRKFDLAAILTYENGKSRYESMGEVDEAIDFMRYYANEMEINKGYIRKTRLPESAEAVGSGFQGAPSAAEKVTIRLLPYGIFGVIAPFNFPVSISVGMSCAALITGNTVVFKPSSTDNMTMLTGLKIYELYKDAGLPAGVFNYITGPGSVIGEELVMNDKVGGIVFTGSKSTGIGMVSKATSVGRRKLFITEMGGKNPVIISKNADLDAAVSGVASAAFGFSGQKCSALSRVYVHESVKEQFIGKLIEKTRYLKIGNPIEKGVYIGPLISESARKRYEEAIKTARASARVLYGGNIIKMGLQGSYVEPTIIEAKHDSELVHNELFLPILTIEGFTDLDNAIGLANDTEYGLTAGFYGRSKKEIRKFIDNIEAGVVYVNRKVSATTGAIVGLHTFVGWKSSGLTGKGTGSKFYLQQFMREQSLSIS
jgi:1-pyrroline-5-carboxylate dehydrogenase